VLTLAQIESGTVIHQIIGCCEHIKPLPLLHRSFTDRRQSNDPSLSTANILQHKTIPNAPHCLQKPPSVVLVYPHKCLGRRHSPFVIPCTVSFEDLRMTRSAPFGVEMEPYQRIRQTLPANALTESSAYCFHGSPPFSSFHCRDHFLTKKTVRQRCSLIPPRICVMMVRSAINSFLVACGFTMEDKGILGRLTPPSISVKGGAPLYSLGGACTRSARMRSRREYAMPPRAVLFIRWILEIARVLRASAFLASRPCLCRWLSHDSKLQAPTPYLCWYSLIKGRWATPGGYPPC